VGLVAIVLLGCALILVAGVEWPRVAGKVGREARVGRRRARRKEAFRVIDGEAAGADTDEFAKSVERDLANLPVIEERGDDRSRRK
jgi:hypothetical protein